MVVDACPAEGPAVWFDEVVGGINVVLSLMFCQGVGTVPWTGIQAWRTLKACVSSGVIPAVLAMTSFL
jgi:hypothetical protein